MAEHFVRVISDSSVCLPSFTSARTTDEFVCVTASLLLQEAERKGAGGYILRLFRRESLAVHGIAHNLADLLL